jgi:hypothetical protein
MEEIYCDACQRRAKYWVGSSKSCGIHLCYFVELEAKLSTGVSVRKIEENRD